MTIRYKRPQHYAIAEDVWPTFDQCWRSPAHLIAWFMRDILLPPHEPHFGGPP